MNDIFLIFKTYVICPVSSILSWRTLGFDETSNTLRHTICQSFVHSLDVWVSCPDINKSLHLCCCQSDIVRLKILLGGSYSRFAADVLVLAQNVTGMLDFAWYILPRAKSTAGQRALSFKAVSMWNNLSNYLKRMSSRSQFKTELKRYFHRQYINECKGV